ncbi:hypothetical protein [Acinetobacter sp. ANC 4640]
MIFSKVALLSALAGMSIPSSYTNPAFILPDFSENPNNPKQNKLSQKKRRLMKRRLNKK